MKSFIYKILCFFFWGLIASPTNSFAQASGSTEENVAIFCDDLAAFCDISAKDIENGGTDVIHDCIAQLDELYKKDEENQQLVRRIMWSCFEGYSYDLFMASIKSMEHNGGNFETKIDDIISADRTTIRDENTVSNKISQLISKSIGSLVYTYSSGLTMESLKKYFADIESNKGVVSIESISATSEGGGS